MPGFWVGIDFIIGKTFSATWMRLCDFLRFYIEKICNLNKKKYIWNFFIFQIFIHSTLSRAYIIYINKISKHSILNSGNDFNSP